MVESVFNADAFLNTEITGEMDTKVVPIPEGDWSSQVMKVAFREVTQKDGVKRAIMDVTWEVLDEEVKKSTKLEKPMARQSVFLDLNEQGGLDMGKGRNIQLGKLREAVGQNRSGKAWSPAMLTGQMAIVSIKQRIEGDDIYSDIKKVTKL
jgi:hypothetical protein